MSKYGQIKFKLSDYFSSEQIQKFADENGISYDESESIAKELVYRKIYTAQRNKDPKVKAKRKAYNQKRNQLRKLLKLQ